MHAKIFQSGNSQAVRIPKSFRFDTTEVEIYKRGDAVILKPINQANTLEHAFNLLVSMPDDFMKFGREDAIPQERDCF
jgi:antitoxin VapB